MVDVVEVRGAGELDEEGGIAVAVGGTSSNATWTSKVAMKSRDAHVTVLPLDDVEPVSVLVELVEESAPGRSELSTDTRVTPSMSRSAARNVATASCPDAQPWMSSDGPTTPSTAVVEAEPIDDESDDALAVTLVSQTSPGRTRASSRMVRSQSNRLVARLATVSSRACCRDAKFV